MIDSGWRHGKPSGACVGGLAIFQGLSWCLSTQIRMHDPRVDTEGNCGTLGGMEELYITNLGMNSFVFNSCVCSRQLSSSCLAFHPPLPLLFNFVCAARKTRALGWLRDSGSGIPGVSPRAADYRGKGAVYPASLHLSSVSTVLSPQESSLIWVQGTVVRLQPSQTTARQDHPSHLDDVRPLPGARSCFLACF